MRSLEGRLHLGLAAVLLFLLPSFWWFGHEALRGSAESFVLNFLQRDAEALVGNLVSGSDDGEGSFLGGQPLTPVYRQPYSGHYYVLLDASGGRFLSRSLWDHELAVHQLASGETSKWYTAGPDGQRLLVWASGYRSHGEIFTLAVARDLAPLDDELAGFERRITMLGLAGFLILVLVQHFVVFRAFASLHPVYADIERLERGETVELTEQVPNEILPLVRKLNRLLANLAQRLQRSRRAAADLAHAVKGPLTLMHRHLERSDRSPDDLLRGQLSEQVERVQRLMERELRRARLAGTGAPGRRFDPREELPAMARLLGQMYAEKCPDIEWRVTTEGLLATDREDMLELLGVLLDNACKWADTRVLCTVAPAPQGMILCVEDDGPGCARSELALIRRRGARLDEQVNGHGLGLSIASDIVETYNGSLVLGRSPNLGGFLVEADLPVGRSGVARCAPACS